MRSRMLLLGVLTVLTVSCQGTRPENLGPTDGLLQECPDRPNCVFSESKSEDHKIEPLAVQGSPSESIEKLAGIIGGMEKTRIIEKRSDYLYAEFESDLLKFVDDVEFFIPEGSETIQVRSASRIGYSDRGVNGERIAAIRKAYQN